MARSSLRSLSFVLLLLGAACGDDGGSSTSPAEPPSGDPSGTPVSSTIGSAGGMVASADGRLEIVIPAGSGVAA